jgi:methanogenic corrinoid protein MtbC1
MNPYFETFDKLLREEKKAEVITFSLDLLSSGKIDPVTLYEEILTPSLNNMTCLLSEKHMCIWNEHVRTATVRTIVECCYPYILKELARRSPPPKGTAVVLCPPEEYHDLGARMAADFFSLCGYTTIFIGSNTPYQDFYNAADLIQPEIIAIGVSNYYNLVITKKIITELRRRVADTCRIVVGGNAFQDAPQNLLAVGADEVVHTFADIRHLADTEEVE